MGLYRSVTKGKKKSEEEEEEETRADNMKKKYKQSNTRAQKMKVL
jgi:hypothetical protein